MPTVQVCLQWTAIILNTFTLIFGCLAGLASLLGYLDNIEEGYTNHIDVNQIVQFSMEGTVVLAAIVGCFGAFLGSIKVLVVHIILLVSLLSAHIWSLVHRNETKQMNFTEDFVTGLWAKELVHPGSMDQVQRKYECCGNNGFADYVTMTVPQSCYHTIKGLRALSAYAEGCMTAIKRAHLNTYQNEKWAHNCFMGYEIICIILAVTLCCQLTTKPRRYNY